LLGSSLIFPGCGREPTREVGLEAAPAVPAIAAQLALEPVPGLSLPRLQRATAGRRLAFIVMPLEQDASGTVPDGFHVERGDEIVSAAIALQLEGMGYPVALELPRALTPIRERLGDRFRVDLDGFELRAMLSGNVRFTVRDVPAAGGRLTTAQLETGAVLSAANGRLLYMRRIRESASLQGGDAGGAAERAREAAGAALKKLLHTLLGDPRLEGELIRHFAPDAAG
jgi:hypothetical protein